ncbi:contractile injection system protein, VgrG/Pvc8 family [Lachnospiraceae bacterium 64-25]|nr:hypothetical protein IMSAGC005_02315 [Lachnospiraceae bacterium]
MSDKITLGNLRIRCRFPVVTVEQCRIHAECGRHTEAEIVCIVKGNEAETVITQTGEDTLEIVGRKEDGKEEILFSGVIRRLELDEEGDYASLRLWAASHTWRMDIQRKSRSFQDLSQTYREVAETVLEDYQGVAVWNIPDRQLTHPLIQYKETDYAFLKRIMSHLGACVTAEGLKAGTAVHAGMRKGIHRGDLDVGRYAHSLVHHSEGCMEQAIGEGQSAGYEIHDMDYMQTGDMLRIQGREFFVMASETIFVHNVLSCTCRVFPAQCFTQKEIPAHTLEGAVLEGKVLSTGKELVRLHLDIDREQSFGGAYDFPWKPFTGNLFYSMPEPGTRAALYFGRACEESGEVIYNIRENGESCGELADYHDRFFTTENKKQMYLKPSEMGLLNREGNNAQIALKDDSLVQVRSEHRISMLAEGRVELKGKNVTVTAPKEATLVRKDMLSPTVINLCNAFDAIGRKGSFAASEPLAEKKKRAPGGEIWEDRYPIEGAVSAILSNIPMDGEGDPVMEKIAGSMPVII